MIEPFVEAQKRDGVISYGLSSYGYDARIADEFKIFTNIDSAVIDPKAFAPASFVDRKTDTCIIPPNSFALGHTVEYFRIPRDVLVICLGKSTYARCGIIVNVTPLEPEWEGQVTIEISNTTPLPAKIHAHEGICQFLFLQGNEPCETSYARQGGQVHGSARHLSAKDVTMMDRIRITRRPPPFRRDPGGRCEKRRPPADGSRPADRPARCPVERAAAGRHPDDDAAAAAARHHASNASPMTDASLSLGGAITSTEAPYDIVRKMRASFLVLGPLLGARGGGARFAARRLRHRRAADRPAPEGPGANGCPLRAGGRLCRWQAWMAGCTARPSCSRSCRSAPPRIC